MAQLAGLVLLLAEGRAGQVWWGRALRAREELGDVRLGWNRPEAALCGGAPTHWAL